MSDEEDIMAIAPIDSETTCPICYAEFLEPDDLRLHANQVHAITGTRICHFCVHIFPSLDDYACHLLDTHLQSLSCCKYCTKVFQNTKSLRNHEKKHCTRRQKDVYSCSQCYYVCQSLLDLEKHEFEKHNNDDDGVCLNDCFPHLSSYLNVKASAFLQSYGKKAAYVCACCNITTTKVNKYVEHLLKKQCRSLACDKCSNVYNSKLKLGKHLRSKIDCTKPKVEKVVKPCPKCLKNVDYSAYPVHIQFCNPFKCNHCNITLNTIYELTEHQSRKHPMAILMKRCHFCHKDYVGNLRLEKHIEKVHKSELHLYKYKCIYCDELYFKHPQIMFRHFYSKHPEIKPYCCKICNQIFRIRKNFTVHIKLNHESVGFVEFDERYHVFFSDKKSENPFQPKSLFTDEIEKYKNNESTEAGNQTDTQTETQTDAEDGAKDSQRKPLKIRYKEQKKSNGSNILDLSDKSDDDQTESGVILVKHARKHKQVKRKGIKSRLGKRKIDSDMSEDVPLSKLKRRYKKNTNSIQVKPKKFICGVCNRNCYTFQNYNHHMSLHNDSEIKKCIKCSETFTSQAAFKKHISKAHATSKLTETLKNLLERRKLGINGAPDPTTPEKFRKTIKKVKETAESATVTIKQVNDMSVKKFIENFTPEETTSNKPKKAIEVNAAVSVTPTTRALKPPVIKMTKFNPKPIPSTLKLKMPVRFKNVSAEKYKVNVKLIQSPIEEQNDEPNDNGNEPIQYDDGGDKVGVPEVAEEVMLEEAPQEAKRTQHKIVIPKLPPDYSAKDIRIAHLLPEAPFYKIVRMEDMIDGKSEGQSSKKGPADIAKHISSKLTLPSGTKLVNVNPLAHLIGDKPLDEIVGKQKRNYKSKTGNFREAVAKAMSKLEQESKQRLARKEK